MDDQDIITNEQAKYGCQCDIASELQKVQDEYNAGN